MAWIFLSDERGIATVEYALLLSLIGLVIGLAMVALGDNVAAQLNAKADDLNN